jgi:ubiquinone/menaquinone biosynthesis C-methylase UbiE
MKNAILGNEIERMPDFVFRLMKILFHIFYLFKSVRKDLELFGVKKGDVIADWGCGTGAYTKTASEMVGPEGRVFAVDVHELSVETVNGIIRKNNLTNVVPVLSDGIKADIPDDSVDIVFAIDMFHMVKNTDLFLKEISRITKKSGYLFIEDGHQPRKRSKEKIVRSGCWKIVTEEKRFMKCSPVK